MSSSSVPVIVGLGEVLWDVFPDGPRFGGAPANFACSAAGLAAGTAEVHMVSGVGQDDLGQQALQALRRHGVETTEMQVLRQPTGTVLVEIDPAGHASYRFAVDTAWDRLDWTPELAALARRCDAVCFGTLGQRSLCSQETIRRFVHATPANCWRVLDINLRPPYWTPEVIRDTLPLGNVFKCNDAELPVLADLLGLHGSEPEQLRQLASRYGYQVAALTRGSAGALLINSAGEQVEVPGVAVTVVDTVGAGDAFTAALVLGLLGGLPLPVIGPWACDVAAFVCTQSGATPQLPSHLAVAGA